MAIIWLEEIGWRDLDLSLILLCDVLCVYPLGWFFFFYIRTCKKHKNDVDSTYFHYALVNRLIDQQLQGQFGPLRQSVVLKSDSLCRMKDLLDIHYRTLSVGAHGIFPKNTFFFLLFIIRCTTSLETDDLLFHTDEIKTLKKFRLSFTTASRCDFDLIKLWAKLLCSILIHPRYELQHQRHRQRRDVFSYLDASWTCLQSAAHCLEFFPSLSSPYPLIAPISLFLGHLSSISFLLYLAAVSFMPPPPELMSSAPQASELGMLSVYYTYIFTSLVSKQTSEVI